MNGLEQTGHSLESVLREKVIEHLFLGDLLRCLWHRGIRDIEVLRAEVDRGGHDVVLEVDGIMRHVQLKASYRGAKTQKVSINANLAAKPQGCVVWIRFDPVTLDLGPFLWFGAPPGNPLPPLGDRIGRHTRGAKNERPNIRVLARGSFATIESMDGLIDKLFCRPACT